MGRAAKYHAPAPSHKRGGTNDPNATAFHPWLTR